MINKVNSSNLERVMLCPGSLHFVDVPRPEYTDAAKEGVAAAEYLEHLLSGKPVGTHSKDGVEFSEEIKFFTQGVADELRALNVPIRSEVDVSWRTKAGITVSSRYDISYESGGHLHIEDFKFGYGLVEVKDNWQLISYAIGEVIRLQKAFPTIVLTIRQPRAHHEDGPVRSWEISYEQLLSFKEQIEEHAIKIRDGVNTLSTSKACKYCPNAAFCPAFNRAYHKSIDVVTDFLQDTLSNEQISEQLDLVARIEDLLKTRKGSLQLLATDRIRQGQIIPGYVSEARYGHRTWKDNVNSDVVKALTGIDITETVTLTPAKAEKLRGLDKNFVSQMTVRPILGQELKRKDTSKLGNKIFGNNQPGVK